MERNTGEDESIVKRAFQIKKKDALTEGRRIAKRNEADMDEELEKCDDETDTGDNHGSVQGGIGKETHVERAPPPHHREARTRQRRVFEESMSEQEKERAGEKDAASEEHLYSEAEAVEGKRAEDLTEIS